MPSCEQFNQPRPFESSPTDHEEQSAWPSTSLRMEQVVTQLATAHNVDLSQPGARFNLDRPDQSHCWMITNLDGERIGVSRFQIDEENLLSPDVDIVFAVTALGWEPREILHADRPWKEFAKDAQEHNVTVFNDQGELRYDVFTAFWAQQLVQEGWLDPGPRSDDAKVATAR